MSTGLNLFSYFWLLYFSWSQWLCYPQRAYFSAAECIILNATASMWNYKVQEVTDVPSLLLRQENTLVSSMCSYVTQSQFYKQSDTQHLWWTQNSWRNQTINQPIIPGGNVPLVDWPGFHFVFLILWFSKYYIYIKKLIFSYNFGDL